MKYSVKFKNRSSGKLLDQISIHSCCNHPSNASFWKDVKKKAQHSKDSTVKKWATRSPCERLPLCMRIEAWSVAVDPLTKVEEECRLVVAADKL